MFESKEEKEATIENFFTSFLQDSIALRALLTKKVPEMAVDCIEPKKSLIIGANILTPVIDEMTELMGLNIVSDFGTYDVLYEKGHPSNIYVGKYEEGQRRVIANYSFQMNEYCGTIERKELTNLTSLIMLLTFTIK